jgi:hypothetical protein
VEQVLSKVKAEPDDEALQDGNIVLNATSEFCRTLGDIPTYGQSGNREEEQEDLIVSHFICQPVSCFICQCHVLSVSVMFYLSASHVLSVSQCNVLSVSQCYVLSVSQCNVLSVSVMFYLSVSCFICQPV